MEPDQTNVAFTKNRQFYLYFDEYKAYDAIGAFKNTDVEKWGIPTIYYFGKFLKYNVIAMTRLDVNIGGKFERCKGFNDFRTVLSIILQCVMK